MLYDVSNNSKFAHETQMAFAICDLNAILLEVLGTN